MQQQHQEQHSTGDTIEKKELECSNNYPWREGKNGYKILVGSWNSHTLIEKLKIFCTFDQGAECDFC